MDNWESFDIQVALKIIKHISSGIYRTPGGIFKELINNSYDAGATLVTITTGFPSFSEITIKDNGIGMKKEELEFSFMHVGASQKVLDSDYPAMYGRKIIGMFGIGVLASVHASQKITLRSFPSNENYGLEAELDLSPYFEYINQIKTLEEFKFGTIKYKLIDRKEADFGTTVILKNILKGSNFHQALAKTNTNGMKYVSWPSDATSISDNGAIMENFIRNIDADGVRSIEDLEGREQFLWEIGLICPVEYLEDGPIRKEFLDSNSELIINRIKNDLKNLNFKVYFDGVQVRKPIRLPSTKLRKWDIDDIDIDSGKDFKVHPIEITTSSNVNKEDVKIKATGYILHQPYRLTPLQLMGLYPRIKYVGVGRYDNNFFKVIHGEHPILRAQLSGELYISEGLDEALNLDREGFIEIDPEYQALKESLRDVLQVSVKEAKKTSKERRERRTEIKETERKKEIEKEVVKELQSMMPEKRIEISSPKDTQNKLETRVYSSISIRSTPSKVELSIADLRIEDPRTLSLIVKVDELLSAKSELIALREEFIKIVNKIFKE
jgi:hypothetical protein